MPSVLSRNRVAYYSIATHWHHVNPEQPGRTLCKAATGAMRKTAAEPEGLEPCAPCAAALDRQFSRQTGVEP